MIHHDLYPESRNPSPRRSGRPAARRARSRALLCEVLEERALLTIVAHGVIGATAFEGAPFDGVICKFYDSEAPPDVTDYNDVYKVSIDWGDYKDKDPSPGDVKPEENFPGWFTVTASHPYDDTKLGAFYFVDVKVSKDDGNTDTANSSIDFVDAPLTATGNVVDATAGVPCEVVVASFSDPDPATSVGFFRATINWGDGSTPSSGQIAATGDGTFDVTGTHTYKVAGQYNITVQIDSESTSSATATGRVSVAKPEGPELVVADTSVTEGNLGMTDASFTVTLSSPSTQTVAVKYATADGTATAADNDYMPTSGMLTFAAGETTKTVLVPVIGDTKYEDDEAFSLVLSNVTGDAMIGGDGSCIIINDDPQPPQLAISDVSQREGNAGTTPFAFTITLSPPSTQPVTVQYATADGTATVTDNDYLPASGTLTFAAGETTKSVVVQIVGDTNYEENESFSLVLSNATGDATIVKGSGVGNIINDDLNALTDNFQTVILTHDVHVQPPDEAYAWGDDNLLYWYYPGGKGFWEVQDFDQFQAGILGLAAVKNTSGFYVLGPDHAVYHVEPGISVGLTWTGFPRISDDNVQAITSDGNRLLDVTTERVVNQYDVSTGQWTPVNDGASVSLFRADLASFDFGPEISPPAAGYARVSATTTYSSDKGYGWASGTISEYDYGTSDPLTRDVNSTTDATFAVDLPPGDYQVSMALGDMGTVAHDRQGVFLNGTRFDIVATKAGEVVNRSFAIAVPGGRLDLRLVGLGGLDPYAVIGALQIRPLLPSRFDFGVHSGPATRFQLSPPGYTGVSATTSYSPDRHYGWVSGTIAQAVYESPDLLIRDVNLTTDGTFTVELPPGYYQVSMALGDLGTEAHDRQGVFLNGTLFDIVATKAGEVVNRSYTVAVTSVQARLALGRTAGWGSVRGHCRARYQTCPLESRRPHPTAASQSHG